MVDENVTNQNTKSETKASNPYDALFKEVMTDFFNELQIPIKTEEEVSRKPRTIDIVVTCTPSDIEKVSCETPFDFFAKNNIIAFKSLTDRLTIWEYLKITARARFYIAEKRLATSDTIICAVCSGKPRKVLHESQDTVEFTMQKPWHYVSNEKIPFHVVIIRELEIEYKNYPLLLFAPMRKFREFLKHAIENNRLEYLGYAYLLHPQQTKEVLMMTGKIPIPEENVKFIVKDLTPERILRYIDVEDIIRNISDEDIRKLRKLLNERIVEKAQRSQLND
ncbi:MAG: hypothetical protein ACE5PV_27305 [Candidatus Poribacteria bacterium]